MGLLRAVCSLRLLLRTGSVCFLLLVLLKLNSDRLLTSSQRTVTNRIDLKPVFNFNETCCWKHDVYDNKVSHDADLPPWLRAGSRTKQEFIYVHWEHRRRLGNQLFNYAALFGIAWRNGLRPLWPDRLAMIKKNFNIRIPIDKDLTIIESKSSKFYHVYETYSMTYDKAMERLPTGVNITLSYFFQSWKYFKDVEPALRRDLTFKKDILQRAKRYLESITPPEWMTEKLRDAEKSRKNFVRVAIHIRRTDLVDGKQQQEGWALPRPGYFEDAMNLFRNCCSKVLFVVMSDDLKFCNRTIFGQNVRFVPPGNPPIVDLAIASLCDHAIITFGTFGFWVAWFANGITVTQKNFPTTDSILSQRLSRTDFYKPEWIAL